MARLIAWPSLPLFSQVPLWVISYTMCKNINLIWRNVTCTTIMLTAMIHYRMISLA